MDLSKVLKQLIPITQFNKGKASQLFARVQKGETLVVLKNNSPVAVVISPEEYIIIDAPLLIESRLNEICNIVIAVISDKQEQIKRICKRDNLEESTAKLRLEAQKDNQFYKTNADYIVENNGGKIDAIVGRIRKLVQEL